MVIRPTNSAAQQPGSPFSWLNQQSIAGLSFLFFVMIVLLFTSCQEESQLQTDHKSEKATANPYANYLFKAKQNKGILPRDTRYSVGDALEYLNDGLNFIYCRPDDYYFETKVFRDTFALPISSSQIDEGDLIDLMDDIAIFAGDHYYADEREDKEPLMFNMVQVSGPSPSFAYIEASFAMEAGLLPESDDYPYDDSWIFGQFGGDVSNECNSENVNLDAADLLRRDLRMNITYRNKHEHYYFKSPFVVCFSGMENDCFSVEIPPEYFPVDEFYQGNDLDNPEDITQSDNQLDLLIFYNYSGFSGYHSCLSDDEMNFYYESMADLSIGVLPNPVGNNVIAQIEVGYELLLGSTIFHSMLVVKALKTPVLETDDQVELPCTECD